MSLPAGSPGARAGALCLALAAALVIAHVASFELDRPITTDIRYSMYFSARTAAGDVPFRDFFENRTPLSLFAGALFHAAGEALGIEPLLAIRVGCLALAAAAGLVIFAIQRRLADGDCAAGIAGLLAYLGFTLLAVMPSIGPFPKLLMAVLGPLAALLAARERWALAGASAALAALDWQIGVLAAVAVLAAAVLTRHERRHAWLRVVAGGLAVALAFVAYLAMNGALEAGVQQVVLSSFVRGSRSIRGSAVGRLAHIAHVAATACPGHLWLAALGVAGMVLFPFVWWRARGTPAVRLACALGVYQYGIVGFSWLDFQGFGDLYILLQSLAFFAGLVLVALLRLVRAAAERLAAVDRRRRAGRVATVAALVAIGVAVRPSLLHPAVVLPTRGSQVDTTLAGQRAVAEDLATRFTGKRFGVIGPSELLFLTRTTNALPFVYWNAATWAFYRASPDEDLRDTLLRVIRESRLDGVIYPEEVVGYEPRLAPEYEPEVFVSPGRDYRVTVLVRR